MRFLRWRLHLGHHATPNTVGSPPHDLSALHARRLDYETMTPAQNLYTLRVLLSHQPVPVPEGSLVAPWLRDLALLVETTRRQTTSTCTAPVVRFGEGRSHHGSQPSPRWNRYRAPPTTGSTRGPPPSQGGQPSNLRDSLRQRDLQGIIQSQVATREQENRAQRVLEKGKQPYRMPPP